MNKKQHKLYRIDNFRNEPPLLAPSTMLLKELLQLITQSNHYQQFQLFLQAKLIEIQHLDHTLEYIVGSNLLQKNVNPSFYICQIVANEDISEEDKQYYQKIKELLELQAENAKSEWKGANGHILYQDRNNSLMASSIDHTSRIHKRHSSAQIKMKISESDIKESEIIKKHKNKQAQIESIDVVIQELKSCKNREELKKSKKQASLKYSNFDINFVTTLEHIYLTYMLRSGFKLAYIEYKNINFGIIKHKLKNTDKIGLIGDYGTGLADSFQLMQNMVLKNQVNVILHLGDVYYAGTPEQYENNITKCLNNLRIKTKKEILFYSIPGNHDYYSWGMPFLCFLKQINSDQFTKQQASYFCLRTEDDQWQFLGSDTAYHDSNPFDQIDQTNLGPRLRNKQVIWHKDKMQNFKGSTIFLSHHQLFSIHDRLCGALSKYRHFSCINPILSRQLFEYMPYFSAWFWGHEHAFMLFKQNFLGVPLCRLLGNSSFHVIFEKEHPYHRKQGFPTIPFIVEDEKYLKRYLPLNPKGNTQNYLNLCYGVIDLQKSKGNLLIEYYCSACFDVGDRKKKHFDSYKLYQQIIYSKQQIKNRAKIISCNQIYYLKSQIGLLMNATDKKLMLNFNSSPIKFISSLNSQNNQIIDQQNVLMMVKDKKQNQYYCLSQKQGNECKVELISNISQDSAWTINKKYVMNDTDPKLSTINVFSLKWKQTGKYLGWKTSSGSTELHLSDQQQYWILLQDAQIISS